MTDHYRVASAERLPTAFNGCSNRTTPVLLHVMETRPSGAPQRSCWPAFSRATGCLWVLPCLPIGRAQLTACPRTCGPLVDQSLSLNLPCSPWTGHQPEPQLQSRGFHLNLMV